MNARIWVTTILCLTAFSMNLAWAANEEGDDTRGFDTPEQKQRNAKEKNVNPKLNKEYANIATLAELDPATQEKLLNIQLRKEKVAAEFDEKNAKAIQRSEEAAASKNKNTKRQGDQALAQIEVRRERTLAKFDIEVHKLLTPQQKAAIDGNTLWQAIRKNFEEFRFSEEQNKQSAKICAEMAMGYRGRGSIGKDRSKKAAAMKRIAKEVFTEDQKNDYKRAQADRRRAAADATRQKQKAEEDKKKAERAADRKEQRKKDRAKARQSS